MKVSATFNLGRGGGGGSVWGEVGGGVGRDSGDLIHI